MGDTASTTLNLRKRVFDFLISRGVSEACPACGSHDRRLDEDANELAAGTPSVSYFHFLQGNASLRAVLPLYILVCDNCGNVQMFDRHIVDTSER